MVGIRHPNRATQRAKTLMSYASSLGLSGTIAACVQTKETGVGAVMRQIVEHADAAMDTEDDATEGVQVLATDKESVAETNDGAGGYSCTQSRQEANALSERAVVARRVMMEGRGLVVVERSELVDLLAKAGCGTGEIATLLTS